MIVALAGGVGGARLAVGLAAVLRPAQLSVVVNTGDDFEHLGLHISPDLDTVMYTLAGVNNPETGWGRRDESWQFMTAFEKNSAAATGSISATAISRCMCCAQKRCAPARRCLRLPPCWRGVLACGMRCCQ